MNTKIALRYIVVAMVITLGIIVYKYPATTEWSNLTISHKFLENFSFSSNYNATNGPQPSMPWNNTTLSQTKLAANLSLTWPNNLTSGGRLFMWNQCGRRGNIMWQMASILGDGFLIFRYAFLPDSRKKGLVVFAK